ncbi:MAG: WD40 repeat domain-containing serine/threonine-protein kinase, partial [Planctomycetota bacterium]|nr:WD40 repeat domain-containing serine/threonine-protein kinase [Planctomycetota bacterium]
MIGNGQPPPEVPFQERYDLQEKLGEGGFGVVHKAFDYKLRRDVAIKILKSDENNDKDRKRFLREAEALARLKHPHIVKIYDYGDFDDQVYIVMDCLEGENLSKIVGSDKETSIDQYVRWLLTIAEALSVVHDEGLVHRDLKSHNIIIDWDQNAHLLDFGLVFLSDARSRLTKTEGSLGTPAYMSPEQARGKAVDARADIYGWGATLYECLTQRVPFEGVTAINVLHKVINEDPQEPSFWNRRVPADLDVICLKCLEKDPKNRYQNAEELAADLKRFLSGEAILARPRTWAEKNWRRIQRHKVAASLSFALILTIFVGAAGLALQWKQNYETEQNYFEEIASKNRQLENAAEIDKKRILEIELQKDQLVVERDKVEERQRRVAQNKKLAKNSSASFIMKFSRYLAVIGESPKSIGFRDEIEKSLTGTAQYIANPEEKKRYESALTYHRWRGHSVAQTPLITLDADNSKDGVWLKDNRHAVVLHSNKRVTLFHIPNKQVVREFKGEQRQVTTVAVSPDETRLIVGDAYGFVQIWDLQSGKSLRRFQAHKRILRQLDLSPDGQRLITASDDASVRLWDLKKQTLLHSYKAKDKVLCVAFSRDGRRAFAGGLGRSFRVFDVVHFKELVSHKVPAMI